jgi:RNA ligase (TIGR02306 family)
MRKLATIQKIQSLSPIPDADAIEVAQVLGWKVVVKKGEFQVGDLVVYMEIDSLLPEKPEFEFLRKNKFRIRTIKLRGQISQGICFPLDILPIETKWHIEEMEKARIANIHGADGVIGMDVTDILGVEKYEPPIPAELSGKVKGAFPSFLIKTDEERIQTLPDVPIKYNNKGFIATEKLDGSSCSFYWRNGEFGVCGRNWEYSEDSKNSMWKFARQNKIEEKMGGLKRNLALQGEIIGEGIQKNKYKIKGQTVRFFNIFDIDKYEYLSYEEMLDILDVLNLESVPIIETYIMPDSIDEILEYAVGKSVLNPQTEREGIVFVRYEPNELGRVSFKAISNKFLLDNKE